jgi:hypothetical protein
MAANAHKLKKHLSKEEKAKLIKQYVGKDFDIYGQRFEILSKVVEYFDDADHLMSGVEIGGDISASLVTKYAAEEQAAIWLPRIAAILESSAFVAIGEILAVTSAILAPIGGMIELNNANHTSERVYGMRAVAYTTTAWAFDDPMPHNSPSRLHTLTRLNSYGNKYYANTVRDHQKAWNDAQHATLIRLNQIGKVDKEAGQIMYRAIGDGSRQKLAAHILEGFSEEAKGVDRVVIKVGSEHILYPN